jgi:hypothetical protein
MHGALHNMFDGNQMNDNITPTMTVYPENEAAADGQTTGGYVAIKLRVAFKDARSAMNVNAVNVLRAPVHQLDDREFTVAVEKKKGDEKRFREYLRNRHNSVMLLW